MGFAPRPSQLSAGLAFATAEGYATVIAMTDFSCADQIASFAASALKAYVGMPAWELTTHSKAIVETLVANLGSEYRVQDVIAIHKSANIERGAVVKGPAIIGPNCFVAAGAYIRDGCWLDTRCILGPGAELKSSFLFEGVKLAHFNFVGDSILGADCNLEAGAIIANYRNERADPRIAVRMNGERVCTGVRKFGALLGDKVRIGANAVLAPGTFIVAGGVVPRLGLVDQD